MYAVKDSWKKIIETIQTLTSEDYIIKRVFIRDYGGATIKYGQREWSGEGLLMILAPKTTISHLKDNTYYPLGDILNLISTLHDRKIPFLIGNNFYYPNVVDIPYQEKLLIPTKLNNIIYYGERSSPLGVISKEVYNYLLFNDLEIDSTTLEYIKKKRLKKHAIN